MPDQTTSFLL